MIQMTPDDFSAFVDLLSGLQPFQTETFRWRLVDDVLTGAPREQDIRGQLDLAGPPRPAAISLLRSFLQFGQVEPGKEVIGILANKLLDGYVFDPDPVGFLRSLFTRYPLDRPVAPQPPVTEWRGHESPQEVQEKIIGENTLRDIRLLELGLEAATAVVRMRTTAKLGSGFLCGDDVIMTAHHVIPDAATAKDSLFAFFYELDRDRKVKPAEVVSAAPDGLFFADATLDVALVQLQRVPDGVRPVVLKRERLDRDMRLNIIQHPGGHYKRISMQNNFVEYADANVVHYTTSTEPGSSGSPVFDNDFQVVAVHHSGGMLPEPTTQRRYLRNGGSTMIAVLAAVQQRAPELYARLHIV